MVQISEKKKIQLMDNKNNNTDCNERDEIYIEQNTLITLNCNSRQKTSTEYCIMLALFNKH